MAMPRKGHLDAVLHVATHLKVRLNAQLVFDPTYQDIDLLLFKEHDWTRFYGNVKEAIPTNAPEPCGKDVDLKMMVDSNHTGDKLR